MLPLVSAFRFTPSLYSSLFSSTPTLVPYSFVSSERLLAVSIVVIVAVNVDIITKPTKIQTIPNSRAGKERGALSPYLQNINEIMCYHT